METQTIIIVSVFGGAWLLLCVVCAVLAAQVASLRRKVNDLSASGRLRVQKLKMNPDKNHAFHNPGLAPDEELSRRGYSMYQAPDDDVESGRGTERQTAGHFVEELARELDWRRARAGAPPFLLHAVGDQGRAPPGPAGPHGQQNGMNSNFIY